MQIRPVMPSFKGYIELNATRINSHPSAYTTFNTNSIIVTLPSYNQSDYGSTYISNGGEAYITNCPYSVVQKACILADQHKNAIVSIDAENEISINKFNSESNNLIKKDKSN